MTAQIPFLDLRRQWKDVEADVMPAMRAVLADGPYILGPRVEHFEAAMAEYCGVDHAVGVASGTDALRLALQALGIGPGDEVITSPLTAAFTSLAILALGARPVFADVDPRTYNVDPACVRKRLSPRTRAILPVHLHGRMAAVGELTDIARAAGVPLVEDACQAHGAGLGGKRAGAWGVAGCLSFYPTKNLGAYGDGGMVVTSDAALAGRLRALRHGGQRRRAYHELPGTSSRLDELQAAALLAKLPRLEQWTAARRRIARRYQQELQRTPLQLPPLPDDESHVCHLYVIRTPQRDKLRSWLAEHGVGTEIYYPFPLHVQPAFAGVGPAAGDLPQVEAACREILALPCYPELRDAEQNTVCELVREYFETTGE